MGWIVGRKIDNTLLETLIKNPDWTLKDAYLNKKTGEITSVKPDIPDDKIKILTGLETVMSENYNGILEDFTYYHFTKQEENRVKNGDEFSVIWEDGNITGIDFEIEDKKYLVEITIDKSIIKNDGVESAEISVFVKGSDGNIISEYNAVDKTLPILTPEGEKFGSIDIENGVGVKNFSTVKAGKYIFPSRRNSKAISQLFNTGAKLDGDQKTLIVKDMDLLK